MLKLFNKNKTEEKKVYLSAREADIISSISMDAITCDILKEYEEYLNEKIFKVHSEIHASALKGKKNVVVYVNKIDDYVKDRKINNLTEFRVEEATLLNKFIIEFNKLGYNTNLHEGSLYIILEINWKDKQYEEGDE